MMTSTSLDDLPDRLIVTILSIVADAHTIARCATLNRRLRSLRWYVSRLHFSISVPTPAAEIISKYDSLQGAIANILRISKIRAPHYLVELEVDYKYNLFCCDRYPPRVCANWLKACESSPLQSLKLSCSGMEWSPFLWPNLKRYCLNLSQLQIQGNVMHDLGFGERMDYGALTYLKSLVSCTLSFPLYIRGSSQSQQSDHLPDGVTAELFVDQCPLLEQLSIDTSLDLHFTLHIKATSSLKHLKAFGHYCRLLIDAPGLETLVAASVNVKLVRSHNLAQLVLFPAWVCAYEFLVETFLEADDLTSLKQLWLNEPFRDLYQLGTWMEIFELTPGIEQLSLSPGQDNIFDGQHALAILEKLLKPLTSLKSINFYGHSFTWFTAGGGIDELNRFQRLRIYVDLPLGVQFSRRGQQFVETIKGLLEKCGEIDLEINCRKLVDQKAKRLKFEIGWCSAILELQIFFPGRFKIITGVVNGGSEFVKEAARQPCKSNLEFW